MKGKILKKVIAAALVLTLVTGGVPISPVSDMFGGVGIVASAATYTDFLDCSSGTATGYFTYNNHFYKVYWSGINTSQTTSVLLRDSSGAFQAFRNGSNNSPIGLYLDGTASYSWKTSDIENLSPEQSSSGYTTYGNLATGASSNPRVFKKVCTVTCMAANAPTWNWSADYSTCTATFTCAENSSLTATVNANVTASGNTATASVTFNGQSYSDTKNTTCTVTWKNDDGTVLKTDTVAYNSTPSYGGTPTKAGNAQYSYTFSGWSPAVSAVTSDTTYTAQYTQTTNSYTVTWKNADGTVLETDTNVSYGATPTYNGATPTKASDDKYSYTFKEWSPSVSAVSGNVTYTAQFTKAPIAAHFSQSGDTYTIHDEKGWDIFCDLIDSGETFSGKTIILENDIGTNNDPITVTAGKCDPKDSANDRVFKGVFDGNHKTLTFSATAANNYVAPFANMNGTESAHAAISDLNVKTTITGEDYRHLAGLVAVHTGHVDITNCNADVSISCLKGDNNPSDLYPSGLVSQSNGTLNISGCTVTGSIATDGKYASGLIGIVQKTADIKNCLSSVTIKSSTSGDGTHGGLVGVTASKSTTTIEGCVFGGKLLTVGESDTGNCGGILGWKNANVTISNTIYAPAELTGNEKEVVEGTGDYPSGTFYRGNEPTMPNCYYTRTLGTAQGKAAHTITGAKDVTLGIYGTATQENPDGCTVYSVSGITAYEGSGGLKYGDKYYAGKEDTVNLTLGYESPETTGYKWDGAYNVSAGTLEGSDNPYTLTMPESNVTVSPVIEKDLITVNYIDEDGKEATVEAYLLDGTETTLKGTYDRGWYIVYNDVTFDHTITLEKDTGQVNLILADDRTMTVNIADENSDADGIDINDSLLNIFRQKGGTGTLNVTTAGTGGAINLNDGLLYIYGGIINVTCSDKGKFAIGDTIGTLMRRSINFTGGKVTANGAIINRNEETGKNFEIYCDFSGADDFVYATEYVGNVQVKLGQTITDGTALYEGTLSNDQLTAIAGKKLKFVYPVAINDVRGGTVSADKLFVYPDDQDKTVTLTPSPALGYQLKSYTVKDADNQEITVTDNKFTMSDSPVTVTAEFEKVQSSIEYLDENGTKKTASAYVLDGLEKEISSGWYYISGKTTFPGSTYVSGRITVSGDVHLILCDGCEMNATDGINVSGDNSLTIYAQSVDNEKGILNVIVTDKFLENAGIGSNANNDGGNITINGGVINAAAKEGACIGGGQNGSAGNITINGGVINATEHENSIGGAGIGCGAYGSGGAITINGGTVTAVGAEDSAGIGGAADVRSEPAVTITINGGDISATGGQNGAGIGSGNIGKCGKITITGGNISATGSLEAAGIGCGKSGDSGDIEISGGTVIAEGGAYGFFSGGSGIGGGDVNTPFTGNITISGGDVTATGKGIYPGIGATVSDEDLYMTGKIKISGGKVTANADLDDDNSAASGICCLDIEISKGTVIAYSTGDWPAIGSKYSKGKITISGGDVTAEANGENGAGIGGGTITISGGTVEATGGRMAAGIGGGFYVDGGTITISDGKVTASAGEFGAGIGGGCYGLGGTIEISGGNVTATGGGSGAGIGGGYTKGGGKITISGGEVTATGGERAAGIGGGYNGHAGTIEISGGNVTATGGDGDTDCGGAGIGGGYNGNGGKITISGGTIIATGGTSDYDCGGAGIGSGYNGEGGTITIEDGDITATGGAKAAGIGGGYYKSCGTIKINGGTVKATGGSEGAGIGSGYNGEGGDITINGGKVTAEGGIGNASDYTGEYKCTVNLGYTDKADYITASAYNGEVTVTKDKLFTDSTNLYSGTLTDEQITALAGQTLVPAFMVTLPESVANGTLNADKAFVAANADNKTVTLTVTPDTGYQVKSVKVNGAAIEAVNGVYSFTMPDGDVTVSAEFELQKHTVSISSENCQIIVRKITDNDSYGVVVHNGDKIEYGTKLIYDVAADYGYYLGSENGTIYTTKTYETTVNGDTAITAVGYAKNYRLSLYTYGGGGSPVIIGEHDYAPYNSYLTIKAGTPNEGYEFVGWYQTNGKFLSSDEEYNVKMTSGMSIRAQYRRTSGVVIFMANNQIQNEFTDAGYADYYSSFVPSAKYGYEFTGWDKTLDEINSSRASGNVTVKANFAPKKETFTVTINNGEVNADETVSCEESTLITRTAKAVEGKTFAYWMKDDALFTYNPKISFTANAECVITAVYTSNTVTEQTTAEINKVSYVDGDLIIKAGMSVPDGMTIVSVGIGTSSNSDMSEATETTATTSNNPAEFAVTKSGVAVNTTLYAQAYVTYRDTNNVETTGYGSIMTITAGQDYDAAEKGTATIRSATYNAETKKATFNAYLTVPENAVIVKAGLVAAPSTKFDPTNAVLTADYAAENSGFVKSLSTAEGKCVPVNYTWYKSNVNTGDTWYARAYLVYTLNGEQHTVYGSLVELKA